MPSSDFRLRMERVLAARVEDLRERAAKPRRLRSAMAVIAGTLVCFFLLKAAAVAHDGRQFTPAPGAEAGLGATLHYWIAGADPISTTLAAALRSPSSGAL